MKRKPTITITKRESRYYIATSILLSDIMGVEDLVEEVNATLPNLISEDLGNRITSLQEGIRDRAISLGIHKELLGEETYLYLYERYKKLIVDIDRLLDKVKDNLEEDAELEEDIVVFGETHKTALAHIDLGLIGVNFAIENAKERFAEAKRYQISRNVNKVCKDILGHLEESQNLLNSYSEKIDKIVSDEYWL